MGMSILMLLGLKKDFWKKCHIMNGKYFALMAFICLTYHVYQAWWPLMTMKQCSPPQVWGLERKSMFSFPRMSALPIPMTLHMTFGHSFSSSLLWFIVLIRLGPLLHIYMTVRGSEVVGTWQFIIVASLSASGHLRTTPPHWCGSGEWVCHVSHTISLGPLPDPWAWFLCLIWLVGCVT